MLAERGIAIGGAKVLILGIAYKKDVEDTRESPALALFTALEERGASVSYHDPFFPELPPTRDHAALAGRRSVPLDAGLGDYDAVVIATDHSGVDYQFAADTARLIVDTRNALAKADVRVARERLLKL